MKNKTHYIIKLLFVIHVVLLINFPLPSFAEITSSNSCLAPKSNLKDRHLLKLASKLYGLKKRMQIPEFNEREYYGLARSLLEKNHPESYMFFIKTDKFFGDMLRDEELFKSFRKKIGEIARLVGSVPGIKGVYGTGFPFYGNVDIRERIYQSLLEYKDGKITLNKLKLKMKPDIDLVIAVDYRALSVAARHKLQSSLEKTERWKELQNILKDDYNIGAIHFFENTEAKIQEMLDEYLDKGTISLDLLSSVPSAIMQDIPYLIVSEEDFSAFHPLLSDCCLTMESLHNEGVDYVLNFRVNILLKIMLDAGEPLDREKLIKIILEEQVYSPIISNYSVASDLVRKRWEAAINVAVQDRLLALDRDNVVLTDQGKHFITYVLGIRAEIIGDLRVLWNMYTIDKSDTPLIAGKLSRKRKAFIETQMQGLLETHSSDNKALFLDINGTLLEDYEDVARDDIYYEVIKYLTSGRKIMFSTASPSCAFVYRVVLRRIYLEYPYLLNNILGISLRDGQLIIRDIHEVATQIHGKESVGFSFDRDDVDDLIDKENIIMDLRPKGDDVKTHLFQHMERIRQDLGVSISFLNRDGKDDYGTIQVEKNHVGKIAEQLSLSIKHLGMSCEIAKTTTLNPNYAYIYIRMSSKAVSYEWLMTLLKEIDPGITSFDVITIGNDVNDFLVVEKKAKFNNVLVGDKLPESGNAIFLGGGVEGTLITIKALNDLNRKQDSYRQLMIDRVLSEAA